jgi:hypothetical protein
MRLPAGVLGSKLEWFEGYRQNHETVQLLLPKARLILEVDADEVWPAKLIAGVLRAFRNNLLTAGRYRTPMIHHWRSFDYVCRDTLWPVRVGVPGSSEAKFGPAWDASIHHFGYARSVADTRYKIETSAHKGEWRAGWLDNVFLRFPSRLTDLHPVVADMWAAEPYDRHQLPEFMRGHPWFNQEVIA